MKAVIVSIIARLIAYIGVLAFVFGLVYTTQNTGFLWLLFLLLTVEFVPVYNYKSESNTKKENGDPFDGGY